MTLYDPYLAHYGVKGMKWGVRKSDRPSGVSRKTNREAKRDAKEFTEAKMFYGQGAGTRRKLIKTKVNQKSRDPSYKKAFDHHVANTDMATRAESARSQRKKADRKNAVRKTVRGTTFRLTGSSINAVIGAAAFTTVAAVAAGRSTPVTRAVERGVQFARPHVQQGIGVVNEYVRKHRG